MVLAPRRQDGGVYHIRPLELFSLEDAVRRVSAMIGATPDWTVLGSFIPAGLSDPLLNRSAVAATFLASLELAKAGALELRQDGVFAPIYVRRAARNDSMPPPEAEDRDP